VRGDDGTRNGTTADGFEKGKGGEITASESRGPNATEIGRGVLESERRAATTAVYSKGELQV
jgi:hypothetical protein